MTQTLSPEQRTRSGSLFGGLLTALDETLADAVAAGEDIYAVEEGQTMHDIVTGPLPMLTTFAIFRDLMYLSLTGSWKNDEPTWATKALTEADPHDDHLLLLERFWADVAVGLFIICLELRDDLREASHYIDLAWRSTLGSTLPKSNQLGDDED